MVDSNINSQPNILDKMSLSFVNIQTWVPLKENCLKITQPSP